MPLLPLQGGRLVYGSQDGGKTVHADDTIFNKQMKRLGTKLHVAGHLVKSKELYSAGDVEGHMYALLTRICSPPHVIQLWSCLSCSGVDGHRYLLDLARAFPPESPLETTHLSIHTQSVFCRLLRPEFLAYLKVSPLDDSWLRIPVRPFTYCCLVRIWGCRR